MYLKLLKEISREILRPLTMLFNMSLHHSIIPSDWKMAKVTPILKKRDRKLPENYRPISLTSIIGKLFETIIPDKVVNYLECNSLILDSQNGFCNNISCLSNILRSITSFLQSMMFLNHLILFIWTFRRRLIKLHTTSYLIKSRK